MQIRRVLLLFALVLGLSALVASLAPPPEERRSEPAATVPDEAAVPAPAPGALRLTVARPGGPVPVRRAPAGSSVSLEVSVREPGDVVIERLGLRQSADRLAPATFSLLAEPPGRHAVTFHPLDGRARVVGRLEFVRPRPHRG